MKLTVDGQSFAVEPGPDGDLVLIDGTPFKIRREGNGSISTVLVDGRPYKVDLSLAAGMAIVDGAVYQVSLEGAARTGARGPAPKKAAKQPVAGAIRSLMPGKIRSVKCRQGDTVAAGDVLCILEAMKMENEIRTPVAGVVTALPVTEGSNVDKGDTLAVVE
ncbi:MAG: biotin/lipoyl-containing protein [Chloroflexota bacterium]|nr:biotin/lipoyl-containing protein [Chloroflexota bacterium]